MGKTFKKNDEYSRNKKKKFQNRKQTQQKKIENFDFTKSEGQHLGVDEFGQEWKLWKNAYVHRH